MWWILGALVLIGIVLLAFRSGPRNAVGYTRENGYCPNMGVCDNCNVCEGD